MSLNFCPECGVKWVKNAKFCTNCGYQHSADKERHNSKENEPKKQDNVKTPMNLHQKMVVGLLGVVAVCLLFVFTQKTIVKKEEERAVKTIPSERLDELAQQFQPISLNGKEALFNAKNWEDSLQALQNLIQDAEAQNRLEWAGYYRELIANKEKTEIRYLDAASRYFEATKTLPDTSMKRKVALRAISIYEKVLKINPNNINASVDMAVCYTLTGNPMQGIFMLKDIADKNPTHILAQHNLGILSMQTGQFEKAVKRFEKVLSLKPENSMIKDQALLYAGIGYLQIKKYNEAKQKFNELLKTTQNPNYQAEAKQYLSQFEK
ncbi:MAG: tetratricopeptide repeat protein [Bacteroidia bacterium]|nr:tetratricopeptide repeat protein [Bacteroidia bacterium]MDW8346081.1 tetratricopeptide repeat protein [Bacteroidia bacterium]